MEIRSSSEKEEKIKHLFDMILTGLRAGFSFGCITGYATRYVCDPLRESGPLFFMVATE